MMAMMMAILEKAATAHGETWNMTRDQTQHDTASHTHTNDMQRHDRSARDCRVCLHAMLPSLLHVCVHTRSCSCSMHMLMLMHMQCSTQSTRTNVCTTHSHRQHQHPTAHAHACVDSVEVET